MCKSILKGKPVKDKRVEKELGIARSYDMWKRKYQLSVSITNKCSFLNVLKAGQYHVKVPQVSYCWLLAE